MTWNKLSFLRSFSWEPEDSLRPTSENLWASLSSWPLSIFFSPQKLTKPKSNPRETELQFRPTLKISSRFSSNQSPLRYYPKRSFEISTVMRKKKNRIRNWKRAWRLRKNGMIENEWWRRVSNHTNKYKWILKTSSSSSSSKLSQFFFWSCDLKIGFLIFIFILFFFGSISNY